MNSKRKHDGRNRGAKAPRDMSLLIRLQAAEKETFKDAAGLAGIPLSAWVRERLRQAAIKDLEAAGRPIAIFQHMTSE
jgi:hypothetical protein